MCKLTESKDLIKTTENAWRSVIAKCERKHFMGVQQEELDLYFSLYIQMESAYQWITMYEVNRMPNRI